MADTRQTVSKLHQELLKQWSARNVNMQAVATLLSQLKLAILNVSFLPTSSTSAASNPAIWKTDLMMARDFLEIGSLYSVAVRDIPGFERYVAQLKCYYFDYQEYLPESALKYQILGLNLLRLLSQNRVADFHTELELLPAQVIASNVHIIHPVSLEQWLMEGRYNKVFYSKGNVPAESYTFFIDILLNTIRGEIASCMEAAYDQLSIEEAKRILFFSSVEEIESFAVTEGKTWRVLGNQIIFSQPTDLKDKVPEQLPSKQLICQAVSYARELEMIV